MDSPPASEANLWEKKTRISVNYLREQLRKIGKGIYLPHWPEEKVDEFNDEYWESNICEDELLEFESALAEAEAQFKLDCAMEPEWP